MTSIFDSHCHLQWHEEDDPVSERLARAEQEGVGAFLCVAVDLESGRRAQALAHEFPQVLASSGLHPNDLPETKNDLHNMLAEVEADLVQEDCAAVGETGMDFFRDRSEPSQQALSFQAHLELAAKHKKPVIIHCREAIPQTLDLLRTVSQGISGVMHCWPGTPEDVNPFLDLGLHISFAGNLTYPKNDHLREAAQRVPLDRLLVETDAPFLAPQPKRGNRNESAFITHTLSALAELRGEDVELTRQATWDNACRLFGHNI